MKRGLSPAEAALWKRVARTIKPLDPLRSAQTDAVRPGSDQRVSPPVPVRLRAEAPALPRPLLKNTAAGRTEEHPPIDARTLDAGWDRKLARGLVAPDFTLDLHGHSLDTAHTRLDHGLALACAQGARVVLLITGRARHTGDSGGRGERRGAIRAKFLDWLAHGSMASRIAAIRPAHPRHGGAGAVYVVLRRVR